MGSLYIDDTYNVRRKVFSDGTEQFTMFPIPREKKPEKVVRSEREKETSEEQRIANKNQAKERIFDLARENTFDWFITLTFDPAKVARYDYDDCCKNMVLFTKALRDRSCMYVIVPELHEDGAFHFHGVVAGDLPTIRATSPHTGKPLFDKKGREIYNIPIYRWGFTTATRPDHQGAVSTYLAKYITKATEWLPKHRKCYWASKSLRRPIVEYLNLTQEDFGLVSAGARYRKVLGSDVGPYYFAERGGKEVDHEVNKMKSISELEPVGWVEVPE